jgi:hypothetical protein
MSQRAMLRRRDALNRQAAIVRIHERGRALGIGHSHRGYIIGIHWLAAAYERIVAGEPQDEVMADYGWVSTATGLIQRECARCGMPFMTHDNRMKYCPPPAGERVSRCMNQAKQARHRAKGKAS